MAISCTTIQLFRPCSFSKIRLKIAMWHLVSCVYVTSNSLQNANANQMMLLSVKANILLLPNMCVNMSFAGLALYNRSTSAYEALCDLSILQLLCTEVLKKVMKDGAEKPGIDLHYFQSQQVKFQAYQRQRESNGHLQPLRIGVLMWDEVKVKDLLMLPNNILQHRNHNRDV